MRAFWLSNSAKSCSYLKTFSRYLSLVGSSKSFLFQTRILDSSSDLQSISFFGCSKEPFFWDSINFSFRDASYSENLLCKAFDSAGWNWPSLFSVYSSSMSLLSNNSFTFLWYRYSCKTFSRPINSLSASSRKGRDTSLASYICCSWCSLRDLLRASTSSPFSLINPSKLSSSFWNCRWSSPTLSNLLRVSLDVAVHSWKFLCFSLIISSSFFIDDSWACILSSWSSDFSLRVRFNSSNASLTQVVNFVYVSANCAFDFGFWLVSPKRVVSKDTGTISLTLF